MTKSKPEIETESQAQPEPAADPDPIGTPTEHARATLNLGITGGTALTFNSRPASTRLSEAHELADQVNGWTAHRVGTGEQFTLKRSAYLQALELTKTPGPLGHIASHEAARSPYAPPARRNPLDQRKD